MTAATVKKPRARRIAADEAHAWARNLRLRNSLAKLVLSMLTLYVNGDGVCWVAVPTLAEDCEVSQNTVRSRLLYLEEIGALARFKQWIDESGRRNGEGRGRQTSDEIRLLLDADQEEIEARALGRHPGSDDGGASPQGRQSDAESADGLPRAEVLPDSKILPGDSISPSAALQLRGRPNSSEPEPESTPLSPPSGGIDDDSRLKEFKSNYPIPSNRPEQLNQTFAALTDTERDRLVLAGRGVKAFHEKNPKRNLVDPEKFARNQALWDEFIRFAPPPPQERRFVLKASDEFKARQVVRAILRMKPAEPEWSDDHGADGYWVQGGPLPADAMALVRFYGPGDEVDQSHWYIAESETDQYRAWRARIQKWAGVWLEADRIPIPGTHIVEVNGKPMEMQNRKVGIRVPGEWPPNKGSPPAASSDQPAQDHHKSEQTG